MSAREIGQGLALAEKNDCGEAPHLVLHSEFYVLLFIHFEPGKFDGSFECFDSLGKMWGKGIAGSAPVGPEINQHRKLVRTFDYLMVKFVFVNIEYEVGIGH